MNKLQFLQILADGQARLRAQLDALPPGDFLGRDMMVHHIQNLLNFSESETAAAVNLPEDTDWNERYRQIGEKLKDL